MFGVAVPTVGDEGALPTALPGFNGITVPFTFETLTIIAPYAFGMAIVGLIETLLTAQLVDAITDTGSSKWRESWGQGVANIASAFFGGTGGCAMIGQTVINVKTAGARTRDLDLRGGRLRAGPDDRAPRRRRADPDGRAHGGHAHGLRRDLRLAQHPPAHPRPDAARRDRRHGDHGRSWSSSTDNLATGVLVGVVVAALVFARRVAHVVEVVREPVDERTVRYRVRGALFFASSNDLVTRFSYAEDPEHVVIDMSDAHVFDASTVAALDGVEQRFAKHGSTRRGGEPQHGVDRAARPALRAPRLSGPEAVNPLCGQWERSRDLHWNPCPRPESTSSVTARYTTRTACSTGGSRASD